MLLSGLENFQPNLNMFGSNIFSSIASYGMKESQEVIHSLTQSTLDINIKRD